VPLAAFGALLLVAICISAAYGPQGFGLRALFPLDASVNPATTTLLLVRLPRILLAVLVGGALATVGAAYQSLLKNPLADPFVMGVSGGAALGGTLSLVLGGAGLGLQALCAFSGAALATWLIYRLGRIGGRVEVLSVLLVGVVFNAFASAVITFLKAVLDAQQTQQVLFWLMGNLGYPTYGELLLMAVVVVAASAALLGLARVMNLFAMGEEAAASLGVEVERGKTVIFVAASLLVGTAVAYSGLIGFVGLMVPHAVRLMFGPDHRRLLPLCWLGGATLLVLADLLARASFGSLKTEPPVGVITAFLGGPFFLFLLRRRYGRAFF